MAFAPFVFQRLIVRARLLIHSLSLLWAAPSSLSPDGFPTISLFTESEPEFSSFSTLRPVSGGWVSGRAHRQSKRLRCLCGSPGRSLSGCLSASLSGAWRQEQAKTLLLFFQSFSPLFSQTALLDDATAGKGASSGPRGRHNDVRNNEGSFRGKRAESLAARVSQLRDTHDLRSWASSKLICVDLSGAQCRQATH